MWLYTVLRISLTTLKEKENHYYNKTINKKLFTSKLINGWAKLQGSTFRKNLRASWPLCCQSPAFIEKRGKLVANEKNLVALVIPVVATLSSELMEGLSCYDSSNAKSKWVLLPSRMTRILGSWAGVAEHMEYRKHVTIYFSCNLILIQRNKFFDTCRSSNLRISIMF